MFEGVFAESLLGKARGKGLVDLRVTDIRDHADDKHHTADDRPFGGGPGMVMKPEPLYGALKAVGAIRRGRGRPVVIFLSPQGRPFTQVLADRLAKEKRLVLVCGHYEGIDERLMEWIDFEVSLADVVLTGGEIPAMALVDAVTRKIPGVVKEADSLKWDSFAEGWAGRLDCPHYTRPADWRGRKAPRILLGGDHKAIAAWREKMSTVATRNKRPDLLKSKR